MSQVRDRIISGDATIAVIGLGYVGLPLACHFSEAGFRVIGFDIDLDRVQQLREGSSYIEDVSDDALEAALDHGFEPTTYPNGLEEADAFVMAVPTGVEGGEPDMSAVQKATKSVATHAPNRQTLVVCCSTVYPGATDEVVRETLREGDRTPGDDTLVAFAPERINPGGAYDFHEIPLVVGADSDTERAAAVTLFESVVDETVPVQSTISAELTKVLENTYRMVNIAMVNELARHAEETEIDVWEAIEAAGTKPFGFQAFTPGPGVGGHCIPVDPQFLTWKGRESGVPLELVEQAHSINESMPSHVVDTVDTAFAARDTPLEDSSLAVLGVSYKPNIGDLRNSPALAICEQLHERGVDLTVVDPLVDEIDLAGQSVVPEDEVSAGEIASANGVLLLVDHDAFTYDDIEQASIVFDTQDALPDDVSTTVLTLGEGKGRPERVQKPPLTSELPRQD
ncbi:nucleotide sugar dehydrogenase [Natranaeroarchaeum sulfidigenes]|uniref:UDP-N-acetyl-D-mannosamine dehydrogenase n=1 Tax=Natranaeroarchaeum sulfidigenes TaxID=2784880 RepID=A0A897MM68_9EURY|nr:nucleotide sugar dehydrogenase [Natranaeroarchaeum sulfidigenes]QSG01714.1 UDP-N-acetyl-D-mannosaminuronate dehydrogenase [Natranaeroarchaeum sulfidigenes]